MPPRFKWLPVAIPIVIAAAAFAFHVSLEFNLDEVHGFDEFNTFFGADPNMVIRALSEGAGRQHISHPNLPHFFSLPLKGISKVLWAGRTGMEQLLIRWRLAMFIVPLAAALQCFVAFRVFVRLGFRVASAALLTLLGCVSFSQMVFGSMPESFALSGLAITLAYLLALQFERIRGRARNGRWIALGIFGTGITITNIFPVALLYGVWQRRRGANAPTVLRRVAVGAAVVFVGVFAIRGGVNALLDPQSGTFTGGEYVTKFLVPDPGRHAMMFPSAIINGLTPSKGVWALRNGLWLPRKRGYPYKFTMQTPRFLSVRNLTGVGLIALVLAALFRLRRARHPAWPYCLASMVILAVNWALHSVWGEEQFLYSQHWQFPLLVLIAGLFLAFERLRRVEVPVLAVAVLYVGITNTIALRRIVSVMEVWFANSASG
ncbi:MAG: DUF6080 domain-containing protein [Candidatus Eisenbacteria bacterium]